MALIKGVLGAALGTDRPKTGFGGPQLPFGGNKVDAKRYGAGYYAGHLAQSQNPPAYFSSQGSSGSQTESYAVQAERAANTSTRASQWRSQREEHDKQDRWILSEEQSYQRSRSDEYAYPSPARSPGQTGVRPFAVPQVMFGDGQPFLRAYSEELQYQGISEDMVLRVIDKLNVAIIPNPELQIFQKAASIAGWFVPGAGAIGLMAGQVVVGIGGAFGHASMINKVLSRANLDIFCPRGLEICLGRSKDVDAEVGAWPTQNSQDMTAQQRVSGYGDALAPLTVIRPPLAQAGRRDPIAMVGKQMGQRASKRRMDSASRKLSKGKTKDFQKLETDLKWLMIREASADTMAHWQRVLEASEAALRDEQATRRRQ